VCVVCVCGVCVCCVCAVWRVWCVCVVCVCVLIHTRPDATYVQAHSVKSRCSETYSTRTLWIRPYLGACLVIMLR